MEEVLKINAKNIDLSSIKPINVISRLKNIVLEIWLFCLWFWKVQLNLVCDTFKRMFISSIVFSLQLEEVAQATMHLIRRYLPENVKNEQFCLNPILSIIFQYVNWMKIEIRLTVVILAIVQIRALINSNGTKSYLYFLYFVDP